VQSQSYRFHVGVDENGLGAQLGPLIVTAVAAEVSDAGKLFLEKKLSRSLSKDIDDSKRLVAFGKHELGEAWVRALYPTANSPDELLAGILHQPAEELQKRCPTTSLPQCWGVRSMEYGAEEKHVNRLRKKLGTLEKHGVRIHRAMCEVVCTSQLNAEKAQGLNRFTSDLHAMERLLLTMNSQVGVPLSAVCGKVGGMADYTRFFGPLGGRLHVCLEQKRERSSYHFPGLGEVHFVQDADASHPLVMLASIVGKYVREVLMGNINRFYAENQRTKDDPLKACSGYHDPVTSVFLTRTASVRKRLRIAPSCFERD
jgi:ribonuclease HII